MFWRHVFSAIGFALLFSFDVAALCVSASGAKLRSEANPKSNVTWTVAAFTPLIFLEQRGPWVRVLDQDNQPHWVHINLVTQDFRCVSVARKSVEPRTGPGRNFPPADTVRIDRYIGLKRLERNGEWFELMNLTGERFWLHQDDVWQPIKRSNVSF